MRFSFFVLIFCLIGTSCGEARTLYSTGKYFSVTTIEFMDAERFSLSMSSGTGSPMGSAYGRGKYLVAEDSINFFFDGFELKPSQLSIVELGQQTKALDFTIVVVDTLYSDSLAFYTLAAYQNDSLVHGVMGDVNGRASMSLQSPQDSLELRVGFIGYPEHRFMLPPNGNFEILLKIAPAEQGLVVDTKWAFHLFKFDKDSLVYGTNHWKRRLGRVKNRKKRK